MCHVVCYVAGIDLAIERPIALGRVQPGGEQRRRQPVVCRRSAAGQKSRPSVKDGLGVFAGSRCSSARRRMAVPVARNSVACSPQTWLETATFTPTIPEAFASIASTDRKSTRLNSSHLVISYAVFCL